MISLSVGYLPSRLKASAFRGRVPATLCRVCAKQQTALLQKPDRYLPNEQEHIFPQQEHSSQPKSFLSTSRSSRREDAQHKVQMTTVQRLRLHQWVLQAVSSGTYSLSAILLAGVLSPAMAVGEFNPGAGASVTASSPPSIPDIPGQSSGLTAFEGLLIFAPVILYGAFSIYRSKVNPRAKLSDFLFIAAAGVVVTNVITIIFFKKRLY